MSLGNTGAGFHWTNEYLVPALPWVTGSVSLTEIPEKFTFPRVTKYVKVHAEGDIRIGFTLNGVNATNYFTVPSGTVETFNVRVVEAYVRADLAITGTVDIFAGLTLIPSQMSSPLTGSTALSASLPGAGWPGIG